MRPLCVGILTSRPDDTALRDVRKVEAAVDQRAAADLTQAIRRLGHEPLVMHVADPVALARDPRIARVDLCLLACHGRLGGSGRLQGVIETLGVPYCGPSGPATATAFDKQASRGLLRGFGLPVPATVALPSGTPAPERPLSFLGWPCVVKPRRGAHGIGVQTLNGREDVLDFTRRGDWTEDLLVERRIEGVEVQVVLFGERVLGAMEVHRGVGEPAHTMLCPPQLGPTALAGVYNLARRAVSALDLHASLSRVDILCSPRQNEQILEVEPLPPLHRDGVTSRVARAAGISYEDLVSRVLDHVALPARPAVGAFGSTAAAHP